MRCSFTIRRAGGELSYFVDPGTEFPRLQEAFDLLREAHQKRQQLSIAALVEELLEKTWFWQRAALRPHGDQVAGNLRKALQMIRALEMERPLTLGGLCWLAEPDGGAGPRRGRVADSRSQQ